MNESALLLAALDYAARGWPVIPLEARGKRPIVKDWGNNATTDFVQIRQWWTKHPSANIGIVTGSRSGFFVVDIDVADGKLGRDGLASLERTHGPLPETRRARTGSGGEHILFKMPGSVPVTTSNKGLPPGIDVRGKGGQIVVAPSVHPSGGVYEWLNDAPIVDPPAWLVEKLTAKTGHESGPRATDDNNGPDGPAMGELAMIEPPRKSGRTENRDRDVAVVLEREAANVANAKQGARNDTLNRAAFSMGRYVGAGAIGKEEVVAELTQAASDAGLDEQEIRATIASGLRAGVGPPRTIQDGRSALNGNNALGQTHKTDLTANAAGTDSLTSVLRQLPLSDAGNAEAFALLYADQFRYCHTRRRWMVWDSGCWAEDINGAADRAMLETVRQRQSAGLLIDDVDRKKRHLAYCVASENAKRITDSLRSASTMASLSVTINDFDQDPFALCVGDMAIDLRTGKPKRATPSDMFSLRAGAKYDPTAIAPRWERFLDELFPGDHAMQNYLRLLAGYLLTGSTSIQAYWILQGEGANGKSRFLGTLMHVWGDYARVTGFNTFDADKHEATGNDLAELRGARLVFASEVDEDRPLAEARMKSIAGGDSVTCRHLFGRYFTYRPDFKAVLTVNVLPVVRGQDHGTWRRIRVIRFCQTFDPTAEPNLAATLASEASGILNWAISGARDLQLAGGVSLPEPESVRNWADAYRLDSDTLGRWLSDCVINRPGMFTSSRVLYASYASWCADAGHKPKSKIGWSRDLARKYPAAYKDTVRPRGYEGLGLLASSDEDRPGAPGAPDKPSSWGSSLREVNIEDLGPGGGLSGVTGAIGAEAVIL